MFLRVLLVALFCFFMSPFVVSADSDVEALRKQIEEMQKQNEEMIRKMQEENDKRIRSLRKKIDQLEKSKAVSGERKSFESVDDKSLSQKIESIVDEKIGLKSINSINLGFSKDFPSYYRTRGRYIKDGTFLGVTSAADEIFFFDSRLLISPKLEVEEFLSIRAQFDIARNIIWGGTGDELISDKAFEAPSPGDSFRGAFLRGITSTLTSEVLSAVEDVDLVDIRSLYMVARTPYGEFWIGRQPFDWGLGIFNNAGSMPDQDLGSIVDRLEFDTLPFSLINDTWGQNLLVAVMFDRLSEGRGIGNFDEGDGWDVGFGALYEDERLSTGAYFFVIGQNNFSLGNGITADLSPAFNWSVFASYIYRPLRLSFEFQHAFGDIDDISEPVSGLLGSNKIDATADNISFIARTEYHPQSYFVKDVNIEFGFAKGDDTATPDKIEGNFIFFNNAFVIDNLLYKHVIPTAYALEGSVINSYYLRGWSTLRLIDSLYLTPQAVFAWVDERNALSTDLFTPLPEVDRYLGTELEATLTWKIRNHLWFDLIGSVVFSGGGLDDLLAQRAFIEGAVDSINDANPENVLYGIQGRFIFVLNDLVSNWTGSSTVKRRAWYDPY